jgi:ribosome-associated protein
MNAQEELDQVRRLAIGHLFARKAQEVSWVDLRDRSNLCDCYVLATCQSEVQLHSILSGVRRDLRKAGHSALRAEAAPGSRWGVLDFGDLIVHVFLRDAREYYALERLWKDAPQHDAKPEDYPLPSAPDEGPDEELPTSEEGWE